jgi:hypothetical protein
LVTVLACIGITGYGYANGSPAKLATSYDNSGFQCGNAKIAAGGVNYGAYKYKFFINLNPVSLVSNSASGAWKIGVCAKSCPKKG